VKNIWLHLLTFASLTSISPFGITATTNGSCETTNLEMKPVVVSEIPNAKEELKTYLRLTGLGVRGRKPFYFCFALFCFVFCFFVLFFTCQF
jgi:hypothetical protein